MTLFLVLTWGERKRESPGVQASDSSFDKCHCITQKRCRGDSAGGAEHPEGSSLWGKQRAQHLSLHLRWPPCPPSTPRPLAPMQMRSQPNSWLAGGQGLQDALFPSTSQGGWGQGQPGRGGRGGWAGPRHFRGRALVPPSDENHLLHLLHLPSPAAARRVRMGIEPFAPLLSSREASG